MANINNPLKNIITILNIASRTHSDASRVELMEDLSKFSKEDYADMLGHMESIQNNLLFFAGLQAMKQTLGIEIQKQLAIFQKLIDENNGTKKTEEEKG